MKTKFTFIFAFTFFFATLQTISAQTNSHDAGIDVSHYSAIYFGHSNLTLDQQNQLEALHHQQLLAANPYWDVQRAQYEKKIQDKVNEKKLHATVQSFVTLPVVVHIVYNTAIQNVPDSAVYSQLVVLNEDYGRYAADTSQTPAPFALVAANTGVQFCLAQRDPWGNPSTGIERRHTSVTQFTTDAVKFYAQGGMDQWDPTRYLNIWVCYTGGVCWGEFPTGTVTNTIGAVMNYFYFGSNYTQYGTFPYINNYLDHGEICVHEFGHCFNLYHIWGDDQGACTGTDYCNDTPNQADASSNCLVFPAFDACTTSGNGIMFENYMDYTDDDCLNLFTQDQSARINAVLNTTPYNALVTSNGCQPVILYNDDASAYKIISPNQNACTTFTPVIVLKNWGLNNLTSCNISYYADANTPTVYHWTGNLASIATDTISFAPMTLTAGAHTFTAYTSLPNTNTDSQPSNDQSTSSFVVHGSGIALPFFEGFENTTFVPNGWTLVNPDSSYTWARTTIAAHTGIACAMMDNINYYGGIGQEDDMIVKALDLTTVANPVMAFDVAYTYYNQTSPPMLYTDTLTIYISTDCGETFSVIYNKGGAQLSTIAPVPNGPAFIPSSADWRTEYISLANYQTATNAIIKIRNTSGWGNRMYVDNINIDDALGIQNPELASSVNVFPNPTDGNFSVNVAFASSENIDIKIFDMMGRVISETQKNNSLGGTFDLDLSNEANGIYFVQVKTNNGIVTKKIVLDKK